MNNKIIIATLLSFLALYNISGAYDLKRCVRLNKSETVSLQNYTHGKVQERYFSVGSDTIAINSPYRIDNFKVEIIADAFNKISFTDKTNGIVTLDSIHSGNKWDINFNLPAVAKPILESHPSLQANLKMNMSGPKAIHVQNLNSNITIAGYGNVRLLNAVSHIHSSGPIRRLEIWGDDQSSVYFSNVKLIDTLLITEGLSRTDLSGITIGKLILNKR